MEQIDYKNKYKEALKAMESLYNVVKYQSSIDALLTLQTIEKAFPELAESEDEMIRKEIIEFICWAVNRGSITEKQREKSNLWIAWLENKCEQKPTDKVEPKFKVKYAGNEYNVLDVKDTAGVTYYGIEDEPNHIDYIKAESCEMISGYTIKENGLPYPTKPVVFSKQKTDWSEEDEKFFKTALWHINYSVSNGKSIDKHCATTDWLKGVKERLESIKSQNTWKPNESDILLLERIANGKSDPQDIQASLGCLIGQLKKLKGE